MHLDRLRLTKFRSFEDGLIEFHPHLTAIVGENNGGKSNIIDALRLLFQPTNGRREIYCEESDGRRGLEDRSFRIKAKIGGLSPGQKGLLISAVPDPLKNEAVFGLDFSKVDDLRYKPKHWSGKFEAQPEVGSTDLIRYIYLPPLRDAQRALASGNPTRIAQLLRYFLDKDGEKEFRDDLQRSGTTAALTAVEGEIGRLLRDLTTGGREQKAALGFAGSEDLYDIARDLRFKLADVGIADPEELRHSGLGYANLLFMATVMVELQRSKDADLTLFLVEEPEAHLHPQLQMLVLDFLREKAKLSSQAKVEPGQPEGRIQVIVTTHSPNLTAWIEPENLLIMRSLEGGDGRQVSNAIAVKNLGLDKRDLTKISRYLDVTRSAMLFGGRVMLIEGMAEALLLPVFAERLLSRRHEAEHSDRQKWKRFQSASLVSIDGVDFIPYVSLLLAPSSGARIADKVVVITDRDPNAPGDRVEKLQTLAATYGAAVHLRVSVNEITLEQSLFCPSNEAVLKAAFLDIRPGSGKKWSERIEAQGEADRPAAFRSLFTEQSNPVRKGDFAQALSYILSPKDTDYIPDFLLKQHPEDKGAAKTAYKAIVDAFEVPSYLATAISEIVA
ncbi:putative ATP-dependent endonuclease of the OLD family [Rhizobium leguminosarum bv. trifolii WSM597]|uniref:Putative ATP-dependent endonuclease of the OLD family n=1 Tax=Rhizobium leguminosarum bv. trifolii WSM597 TaxID=754764 RepID=I9NNA3_RHILT|nr:AAA family ATPase [Rhizobium leguminosarum]EJB02328.1 putative ATP-dependent endonuclease of the OLD family [Rhizobium leguminosarum bv. trifolii WSM597]EJB08317.1 putative ATP-dependent endonuclease of the OLD family [Rhizobium leguminosarum bv. trifolii WSM597]